MPSTRAPGRAVGGTGSIRARRNPTVGPAFRWRFELCRSSADSFSRAARNRLLRLFWILPATIFRAMAPDFSRNRPRETGCDAASRWYRPRRSGAPGDNHSPLGNSPPRHAPSRDKRGPGQSARAKYADRFQMMNRDGKLPRPDRGLPVALFRRQIRRINRHFDLERQMIARHEAARGQ